MSRMSLSNCSGYSDCAPSESALSGLQCTSTMIPSAPAATAARAIGDTLSRMPRAWLGSTMIGRCVILRKMGIAERSSVLRVARSYVRIPRSHKITFLQPDERRYSADISHSSIVAESPRFKITGLSIFPSRFNNSKFCILRAPT